MIDESDIIGPNLNYTESVNQASGARLPEYVIRELVASCLVDFRDHADEPDNALNELFRNLSGEALKQIKAFFREHKNIPVVVNWPSDDQHLPWVAVVNQGEMEDRERAVLGDRLGQWRRGVVSGGRQTQRERLGIFETHDVDIIVGTQDPNLTMFLHYAVKRAVLFNKQTLIAYADVQNLVVSGRDLSRDAYVLPAGFYKAMSLQFDTTFDYNGPETSAVLAGVGLRVAALLNGVLAESDVPE